MREIKFRAWDELNGIMMEPGAVDLFIHFDGKLNHHDLGIIQGTDNTPQMTLLQYTGLTDRNGKEIYESDVLLTRGGNKVEVYWSEDWAMFTVKGDDVGALMRLASGSEVIGNLYEAKEEAK